MVMPSERELFSIIAGAFSDKRAVLGVEHLDDAAVIDLGHSIYLVIASDFVRGSEFYLFQLGFLNYFDVGYYLAAANVSDLAAMGAVPKGMLSVVRYAKAMSKDDFQAVIEGINAAATAFDCPVVGGDTGGYVSDVFAATAFGIAPGGRYLKRSSARSGDVLCVSGPIGGGIGALTYFKELRGEVITLSESEESSLLQYWKRPNARLDVGRFLSEHCPEAACMDISDGLKASVDQLSLSSRIGFRLIESQVPIVPLVERVAIAAGLNPLNFASSASVDFELLVSLPSHSADDILQKATAEGITLIPIGHAAHDFRNDLLMADGTIEAFSGISWDHQQGDHVKDILAKTKGN